MTTILCDSFKEMMSATTAVPPALERLTSGPGFHWFGYYDKFQFCPENRFLLDMRIAFDERLPTPDDVIKIGMIDLQDNNRWIELGESRAWCWQQGCMLQWRPGSDREVVWNDREGDRIVSRILDVRTHELRTLPMPIGSLSPDGRSAACEDFSRIWNFRPGYGYPGVSDPYAAEAAPGETGIWIMDMDSGDTRMLVSLAQLTPNPGTDNPHYVNHTAWSPDGKRLLMYDRTDGAGMGTRVFTIGADGEELRLLAADMHISHWAWRDSRHVVLAVSVPEAHESAFMLFEDNGSGMPVETLWTVPVSSPDPAWFTGGHQNFIPETGGEWVVCDTYPMGPGKEQILYLVHLPSQQFVLLGRFQYGGAGEGRCDLHPRVSRDGRWIVIDSKHDGKGRQQYRIQRKK